MLSARDPAAKDTSLPEPVARWAFDGDARDSAGQLHAELKNGAKIERGRLIVDGKSAFAESAHLTRDLAEKTLEAWVALPNLKQTGGGVISLQTLKGDRFDAIVFGEQKPLRWLAGSENFVRTKTSPGLTRRPNPNRRFTSPSRMRTMDALLPTETVGPMATDTFPTVRGVRSPSRPRNPRSSSA